MLELLTVAEKGSKLKMSRARFSSEKKPRKSEIKIFPPVANAIKLLQACIYKSVNKGLFLTPSVAISIVKFQTLMIVFTFKYLILHLSSISNMNLTILVATSDVKNSPVFTDL